MSEEGGTGGLSGVSRVRRGGTCHQADAGKAGLLVVREAKAGIWPRSLFFSGLGVNGGPAAMGTVSAAG